MADDHTLERKRLRATLTTVVIGAAVGVAGAIMIAVIGGTGAAGLAVLLVCTAAGCGAAGVLTMVFAVIDEWRRDPVSLHRVVISLALFGASVVLFIMSMGAASG